MRNTTLGKIILYLYGVFSGTTDVNSKCGKLSHQETLNLDATVHGWNHSPLIKVQCETHHKLFTEMLTGSFCLHPEGILFSKEHYPYATTVFHIMLHFDMAVGFYLGS